MGAAWHPVLSPQSLSAGTQFLVSFLISSEGETHSPEVTEKTDHKTQPYH